MHWTSFSQFLEMGGYGLYVWGSYCVTAIVIAGEIVRLRRRARTLRRLLGRNTGI